MTMIATRASSHVRCGSSRAFSAPLACASKLRLIYGSYTRARARTHTHRTHTHSTHTPHTHTAHTHKPIFYTANLSLPTSSAASAFRAIEASRLASDGSALTPEDSVAGAAVEARAPPTESPDNALERSRRLGVIGFDSPPVVYLRLHTNGRARSLTISTDDSSV